MARLARVVVPGYPLYVTQCGNLRLVQVCNLSRKAGSEHITNMLQQEEARAKHFRRKKNPDFSARG